MLGYRWEMMRKRKNAFHTLTSEFSNELLTDFMNMLRVRQGFTPPYHPQGNYTERANRCVGDWLRVCVNSEGAGKRDWVQFTKYIEFAYNCMSIPGTNISPYMASMGRQPLTPPDVWFMDGKGPPKIGDAAHKPITQHAKDLQVDLEAARALVQAARDKALEESRIKFNADRIEEKFYPGEIVRHFNNYEAKSSKLDSGGNEISIGEIPKLKLKNTLYEVVEQLSPTTYGLQASCGMDKSTAGY